MAPEQTIWWCHLLHPIQNIWSLIFCSLNIRYNLLSQLQSSICVACQGLVSHDGQQLVYNILVVGWFVWWTMQWPSCGGYEAFEMEKEHCSALVNGMLLSWSSTCEEGFVVRFGVAHQCTAQQCAATSIRWDGTLASSEGMKSRQGVHISFHNSSTLWYLYLVFGTWYLY